jgi:hypothetical protein
MRNTTSLLRLIFLTSCATLANDARGQAQPAAPASQAQRVCDGPRFREFDFWVGRWTVRNAKKQVAGENSITLEEGGCVVIERWHSASGGTGQSFNYYDPVVGLWKQRWVGLGLILEMQGNFRNGAMVLEGPLHYVSQKRTTILRGTWTPLPHGGLRQLFEESADNGKTWTQWFDGYYSRSDAKTSAK